MLSNLIFSLNATIPIFLLMVLGFVLRRLKFIDDHFVTQANKFVFTISLPTQLFYDMAKVDVASVFDSRYLLFCAISVLISMIAIWLLSHWLVRAKSQIGEFVQGSYRSSAALFGTIFIQNIYGSCDVSGIMLIGCVPLFNIFAVILLLTESPNRQQSANLRQSIGNCLRGIANNPIILGITAGFIASLLRMPMPPIADQTLGSIARLTAPLALIAIGSGINGKETLSNLRLTFIATAIKLMILPAIFLPIAHYMGFADQKMVGLIIMFGSVTTPSCYVMARQMGHDGSLTASICLSTTIFSALTLTFWLFLARTLGWI